MSLGLSLGLALLLLVTLQRLAELALAARNTRALRAAGAIEYGASHYPLIVGLHSLWLIALWALAHDLPADPWLGSAFIALQGARLWVLASLGRRWTTRILVLPGAAPVRRGPYRYCRHPNYLVVMLEIALLPLAFGLIAVAIGFSLANAAILYHRIRVEEAALQAAARQGGAPHQEPTAQPRGATTPP